LISNSPITDALMDKNYSHGISGVGSGTNSFFFCFHGGVVTRRGKALVPVSSGNNLCRFFGEVTSDCRASIRVKIGKTISNIHSPLNLWLE
jgi:hypothetical protein